MPIYEYQCEKCGNVFEVRQSFSDAPVVACQQTKCKGKVKKLFSPPAIIFKGKGFHVNDYGRGNGNGKRPKEETESAPKSEACATCDTASCPKKDN
jgi:putative FmdB family regulatory protein